MHAYVDNGKANKNIRVLLEGAFDEDKIPRTLGGKKKQQADDDASKLLADRLQAKDSSNDVVQTGSSSR